MFGVACPRSRQPVFLHQMARAADLKPATEDLSRRRPVWDALSTLFLDTDTSLLRPWRAQVLAASDYTVAELEQILLDEVSPACTANLRVITGAWAGFDLNWLEERIVSRRPSLLHRFRRKRLPVSQEWHRTLVEVHSQRLGNRPQGIGD